MLAVSAVAPSQSFSAAANQKPFVNNLRRNELSSGESQMPCFGLAT